MGIFDLFKPNIEKLKEKKDVESLIKALQYKGDLDVRSEAVEAVGKIGDKRAVEPLIQALNDENKYVREGAALALAEIGDKRAVEPLIQALNDKDENVRAEAADTLGFGNVPTYS